MEITPTEAQLTEARSILGEVNRIYYENPDEYFENPECEAHKQVQALFAKICFMFLRIMCSPIMTYTSHV